MSIERCQKGRRVSNSCDSDVASRPPSMSMVLPSIVWISIASPCEGFPAGPIFSRVIDSCSLAFAGIATMFTPAARITMITTAYCNIGIILGNISVDSLFSSCC